MTRTPDIFLSYNREDAEVARRFADGFEAQGFDVWWDQALRSGEAYDEVTEAALRNARAVVVLWSPRSVVSRWVRAEATVADRNRTLVPAKIEACDLPVMFELTQTADLSHWKGAADDRAWLAFLGDVRRMVGKEAPTPAEKPGPGPAQPGVGIPVVAVLPIANRGGGEDLELLAEDLTEEITRDLARGSYFTVVAAGTMAAWRSKQIEYAEIGRALGTRYLAEGRLQRNGETIRLTMQIIDTATSNMPWSDRFSRKTDEIDGLPEAFVAEIVSEIDAQIVQIEVHRAMTKVHPCSGWEHCMRCLGYQGSPDLGSTRNGKALDEARQAVAVAPEFGMAHAMLAATLGWPLVFGGEELVDAVKSEIRTHVTRALRLDNDNAATVTQLAISYAALGDGETCLRLASRAVALDPNSTRARNVLGASYMMLGRTADAIAAFEQQHRLASHDGVRHIMLYMLGACYLIEGRLAEAQEMLDRSLAIHPAYPISLKWKAIVAAQLGHELDALATIRRLREAAPTMPIDQHVRQIMVYKGPGDQMAEPVAVLRRLWDATEGDG